MTRRAPYAATIFCGAFLLFLVQPLIAKAILPWFGGASAVWITCMLFFQSALLAGYAYADLITRRLSPRMQGTVHAALLASSLLLLPVMPSEQWKPGGAEDPAPAILGVLAGSIGIPFFLLATTSPLLQAWSAAAVSTPYRLYSLSNLGSFLALLAYPLAFEPLFSTRVQAGLWSAGYGLFVVLSIVCALGARDAPGPAAAPRSSAEEPPRSPGLALLWVALAACGSTLLLALTNRLSHDLSVTPVLWVLPLGIYLATFILCFESDRWYRRRVFLWLFPLGVYGIYHALSLRLAVAMATAVPLYSFGLFVGCMMCHGELARLRPPPRQLTVFYLCLALGGALGGVFVGLAAPRMFDDFLELPIALFGTVALGLATAAADPSRGVVLGRPARLGLALLAGAVAGSFVAVEQATESRFRLVARNFYGSIRVEELGRPGSKEHRRTLWHGITNHGAQWLSPERRREPTTYYGRGSAIREAIERAGERGSIRVGVLGLGAGVLASLSRPGDVFRFYEINPLVLEVARSEFTFLTDSPAKVEVVQGDARLVLQSEPSQGYDVLVGDAFSSDAVPVHLITREAFALYFRHLKPDGLLVMHVSNRHLDLVPVVRGGAAALGKHVAVVNDAGKRSEGYYETTVVVVAARPELLPPERFDGAQSRDDRREILWTDDFSNLLGVLKGTL